MHEKYTQRVKNGRILRLGHHMGQGLSSNFIIDQSNGVFLHYEMTLIRDIGQGH